MGHGLGSGLSGSRDNGPEGGRDALVAVLLDVGLDFGNLAKAEGKARQMGSERGFCGGPLAVSPGSVKSKDTCKLNAPTRRLAKERSGGSLKRSC